MKIPAAVLACFAFLFFFQIYPNYINENELIRFLLTASIVDDHSFQIDRAIQRSGSTGDEAFYNGHYYAAKPIGYSLLAVPFYYLITRWTNQIDPSGLIWVLRFFINLLPLLFFAIYFFEYLQKKIRIGAKAYLLVAALLFGTLFYPFAQLFMSHVTTGIFWFVAFCWIVQHDRPKRALAAGALLGFSFVIEALSAIPIAACGLYLLLRKRSLLPAFVVGVALFALPTFLYNTFVFGGPLHWMYLHTIASESRANNAVGYVGITFPSLRIFWELTLGTNRGFFYCMPHLVVGVIGLLREKSKWAEALLAFGIVLGNFLFVSGMLAWDGGWGFGPRYLVPVIPFLVYGCALWFKQSEAQEGQRSRVLCYAYLVLLAVTIPNILFGSVTFPFSPRFLRNPILWENLTLFWRGFFGLNAGELLGMSERGIQIAAIVLIVVPTLLFVRLSALKKRELAVFILVMLLMFPLSALFQKPVQDRTDARHCFAIARAGYIQANYEKSLEFFRYAEERSSDEKLRAAIRDYLVRIRSQTGRLASPFKKSSGAQ